MRATPTLRGDNGCRGFVLIELVVVAGLLLVMFTLYWSAGAPAYQKKKKQACRQNLQLIHVALQTYASDHEEKLPVLPGAKTSEAPLSLLVPQYTARTDLFICPGSKDKPLPAGQSFKENRISYAYLMGWRNTPETRQWLMADRLAGTEPKPAKAKHFSADGKPPGNNHDKHGGVILFSDGSAETTKAQSGIEINRPPGTTILNPRP